METASWPIRYTTDNVDTIEWTFEVFNKVKNYILKWINKYGDTITCRLILK